MILLLTTLFFILGLIIGSFLNVVIYRLNTAKSLGGRSACMSCRSSLSWYELIPVFSFVGLHGRCKSCKIKISLQYPIVELISGFIFAVLFLRLYEAKGEIYFWLDPGFIASYVYYAVAFSILLVIAVYDLRHKIIPDRLALVLGILALAGLFLFENSNFYIHTPSPLEFLSGVLIALPFAFLWLVSLGKWMGLGDAKLLLGIGWLLGIPLALSGLVIAFWSGAVIGVTMVLVSKYGKMRHGLSEGMKSEIPFAPFLVFGAFLAFIFQFNFFMAGF